MKFQPGLKFSMQLATKGLITWLVSARAEIVLRLHDEFQPGRKTQICKDAKTQSMLRLVLCSVRAEIPFRLQGLFAGFSAPLPGMNPSPVSEMGLGLSARAARKTFSMSSRATFILRGFLSDLGLKTQPG